MPDRTPRHLPRWSELQPLLGARKPIRNPVDRRLARAHTIADLRDIARRRSPRSVFDYVDGAAESEVGIGRARDAYRRIEFSPRVLRDVTRVDTSRTILGKRAALPLILAPTGFTKMMQHEAEPAVFRAAADADVPYALSTMGTTGIEELAAVVPNGRRWFQLYLWKDRAASMELVDRALDSGYDTLLVTVDTPVAGARLRDVRNGLTIPPQLTFSTLADMSRHPSWWFNLLTTGPLEFASFNSFDGTVAELIAKMFDPSATLDDLASIRAAWPHRLVVKGIQSTDDAKAVVDHGADAIVVSNHGGRQLDRAPTPLELLPSVVEAVGGRAEVFVDTGIMHGGDLVAAVGLGATAGMVGRAYLYGLMAGGERGVARALDILHTETTRTLQLLGVTSIDDVGPEHVRLRT
ncbi:alpha-hydroxy acid oxidase [Antrihabitans spumae]|uniref:Alpha-hydroxy-acid oxidizing protein n=1 Tax=Antrihabitans spumae TaxID=3373370 RepID=A0ABW7KFU3_9NOCA